MPIAAATSKRNVPGTGPAASPKSNGHPTLGAMDAIRTTLATTAKVIRTRLEIISCELEEQREWMQSLLLFAIAGVFCLCMGLVMLTLFVVALFWETHPKTVLGGFAALYIGIGIWAVLTLRGKLGSRPKFFQTTTEELAKDEAQLTPTK